MPDYQFNRFRTAFDNKNSSNSNNCNSAHHCRICRRRCYRFQNRIPAENTKATDEFPAGLCPENRRFSYCRTGFPGRSGRHSDFPADKKNEVDLPGTVLQDRTISIEEAEAAAGITADKIESGIPANKNEQQEFPEPICTSNTDDFSVTSQNPVSNTTISSDEKPEDTAHNFVSDFLSKEQPDRNISIAEAEAAAGISTDELPLETTEFIFAEQHPTLYSKDSSDLYNDEEAAFLNDPFDSHFTGDETENQNTTDVLQNETESYDDTTDTVWTNPVSNSSIPAETISESETGQKKTKELPLPCNNDSPETFTVSFTQTSDACQDEDYISLDELAEARFNAGLEGGLDDEIEEEEEETDPDFPARSEQEDDWDDRQKHRRHRLWNGLSLPGKRMPPIRFPQKDY